MRDSYLVEIEAGMATHYVARELSALGHDVKQVPPAYAKPFRQGHKNDFRDAHAIAEAVQRPSTRCVPVRPTIGLIYKRCTGCDLA
jgi:transposase